MKNQLKNVCSFIFLLRDKKELIVLSLFINFFLLVNTVNAQLIVFDLHQIKVNNKVDIKNASLKLKNIKEKDSTIIEFDYSKIESLIVCEDSTNQNDSLILFKICKEMFDKTIFTLMLNEIFSYVDTLVYADCKSKDSIVIALENKNPLHTSVPITIKRHKIDYEMSISHSVENCNDHIIKPLANGKNVAECPLLRGLYYTWKGDFLSDNAKMIDENNVYKSSIEHKTYDFYIHDPVDTSKNCLNTDIDTSSFLFLKENNIQFDSAKVVSDKCNEYKTTVKIAKGENVEYQNLTYTWGISGKDASYETKAFDLFQDTAIIHLDLKGSFDYSFTIFNKGECIIQKTYDKNLTHNIPNTWDHFKLNAYNPFCNGRNIEISVVNTSNQKVNVTYDITIGGEPAKSYKANESIHYTIPLDSQTVSAEIIPKIYGCVGNKQRFNYTVYKVPEFTTKTFPIIEDTLSILLNDYVAEDVRIEGSEPYSILKNNILIDSLAKNECFKIYTFNLDNHGCINQDSIEVLRFDVDIHLPFNQIFCANTEYIYVSASSYLGECKDKEPFANLSYGWESAVGETKQNKDFALLMLDETVNDNGNKINANYVINDDTLNVKINQSFRISNETIPFTIAKKELDKNTSFIATYNNSQDNSIKYQWGTMDKSGCMTKLQGEVYQELTIPKGGISLLTEAVWVYVSNNDCGTYQFYIGQDGREALSNFIIYDSPLEVKDTKNDLSVEIHPNPNNGVFYLDFTKQEQKLFLNIYNEMGGKMLSLENVEAQTEISLPSNISSGTYFLLFSDKENNSIIKKVIISK